MRRAEIGRPPLAQWRAADTNLKLRKAAQSVAEAEPEPRAKPMRLLGFDPMQDD